MARRPGLFGGFNPLRFTGEPNEKLMLASAALSSAGNGGDPSALIGVGNLFAKRRQDEARQQALAELGGFLGGGQSASMAQPQSVDLSALARGDLGPTETESMQAQGPRVLPNLSNAAPALLRAQQAGIDIGPYVNLLDKAGPDIAVENGVAFDRRVAQPGQRIGVNLSNVNGNLIDTQDPTNANRFVPQVGEGQRLLYDAQGNPVIQNIEGYAQALGQREGTVAAARAASTNPYALETVMGPDGRPITASRQQLLGGGPILGQSEAQRVGDVERARTGAEREGTAAQARARLQAANQSATGLTKAIDTALGQIGPLSTGLIGATTSGIPGSPSKDLRATIDTIKANVGFDYLQQMRELSPTGGALGQVAVQEMLALQAVLGNLDPTQSPPQLARNLEQIRTMVENGHRLREEAYQQQYGGQRQPQPQGGGDRAAQAREILRQRGRL